MEEKTCRELRAKGASSLSQHIFKSMTDATNSLGIAYPSFGQWKGLDDLSGSILTLFCIILLQEH